MTSLKIAVVKDAVGVLNGCVNDDAFKCNIYFPKWLVGEAKVEHIIAQFGDVPLQVWEVLDCTVDKNCIAIRGISTGVGYNKTATFEALLRVHSTMLTPCDDAFWSEKVEEWLKDVKVTQEERFKRKLDEMFPTEFLDYCLPESKTVRILDYSFIERKRKLYRKKILSKYNQWIMQPYESGECEFTDKKSGVSLHCKDFEVLKGDLGETLVLRGVEFRGKGVNKSLSDGILWVVPYFRGRAVTTSSAHVKNWIEWCDKMIPLTPDKLVVELFQM